MSQLPNDLAELKPEDLNAIADEKGKNFTKIKTNQIRNVFANINAIRTDFKIAITTKDAQDQNEKINKIKRDLVLLKPKLAYAAGRQNVVKSFQEFLFELINKTVNSKKIELALENFFIMVESVVAYHKFHGGKDK
jgi:CRISPR-associated protein Csm2